MKRTWVTKRDVVREYGVSMRTVDKWIAERKIPYYKVGKLVRFDLDKVAKALERYTIHEVK
jgi:excisionase family DNA binding protein